MNIYLENRDTLNTICKGQKADLSVAVSMFDEDMRNGTSKYATYTDALREQYKALDNAALTAQTSALYDEYNRCIRENESFIVW